MVKPRRAVAPFRESDAPTTHAAVAPLIRELFAREVGDEEFPTLLSRENRLCRKPDDRGQIECWHIRKTGAVDHEFLKSVDFERELQPLSTDVDYTLVVNEMTSAYPDFACTGGNCAGSDGVNSSKKIMRIRLRLPENGRTYRLDARAKVRAAGIIACAGEARVQIAKGRRSFFSVPLKSTDRGDATVTFELPDSTYGNIVLTGFRLTCD